MKRIKILENLIPSLRIFFFIIIIAVKMTTLSDGKHEKNQRLVVPSLFEMWTMQHGSV